MLRLRRITAAAAAVSLVVAVTMTAVWLWLARHRPPAADEFFVYAAFLSRLSKDDKLSLSRFALADTTFRLVAPTGKSWLPPELRPYSPDEAEASKFFADFCGALCVRDFMTKNLRAWPLKTTLATGFQFDIVPTSAEVSVAGGGKRIVTVTRPGFDLWHHRAVFSYSFDCNSGRSPSEDALSCVKFGQVLLERTTEGWQVVRYSALLV